MGSVALLQKKILYDTIYQVCNRYIDDYQSTVVAELIVKAEMMGVSSHGLHYFLHSVLPLIKKGKTENIQIEQEGNLIHGNGCNSIGLVSAHVMIGAASKLAKKKGISIILLKNPGKVGALRLYCSDVTSQGQLIMMMKNTAPTMGTTKRFVGTNPLCIGIPDTPFVYDSSMATVATNKIRLQKKRGTDFDVVVGEDDVGRPTKNPEILLKEGHVYPFSKGDFWYKSFYLGVAIELMCAFAGGKTRNRVGDSRGNRLESKEGMIVFIVDKKVCQDYDAYLMEINQVLCEMTENNLKIPGTIFKSDLEILGQDLQSLQEELE